MTLLDQAEFADNPEPRCPVVLLLDVSGSMQGQPIRELNAGLQAFSEAVKADRLASLRVEVAIITFGGHVQALDVRSGGHVTFPHHAFFDLSQPLTVECTVWFDKQGKMPVFVSCGHWNQAGWFLQWLGN